MTNPPFANTLEKLSRLRLPGFAETLGQLHEQDPERALAVAETLDQMTENEIAGRAQRTIARRIKQARFIRQQTVDTFDFNYNASTRKIRTRYLQLLHADTVAQGVGAVFVGNSGLGKTHLARALGYAACQRQYSVLFLPCSTLLNRLVTAEATKDLGREIKKLESPSLLVIDELAYVTMSHDEANLFFQVVSRRHDTCRPTVVTTNKPFSEWNQVFHGDGTAIAIIDRLTERAEIFFLEGKSYRQTHRRGLDPATSNDAS
jgi:DNA replication protein DnaC